MSRRYQARYLGRAVQTFKFGQCFLGVRTFSISVGDFSWVEGAGLIIIISCPSLYTVTPSPLQTFKGNFTFHRTLVIIKYMRHQNIFKKREIITPSPTGVIRVQ